MNEYMGMALDYETENYQKIFNEVAAALSEPNTVKVLHECVVSVAVEIEKMYTSSPDNNFVFVVGGKSRMLTETLLESVVNQLPNNHPAVQAIKQRIRLDDVENKNLYGERTSTQTGRADITIPVPIAASTLGNRKLVVCDDSMETGRKVFQTLSTLENEGIDARYIVFSGPREFSSDYDYLKPNNWESFRYKVVVGTNNPNASKVIKGISTLLSRYANLRLNKNIHSLGQSYPATIDTVTNQLATVLRSSTELLTRLRALLVLRNP